MKFGLFLESQSFKSESLRYNFLKHLIKKNDVQHFVEELERDIDRISSNFTIIMQTASQEYTARFGVLNIIAIEKIVKKYNRWITPSIDAERIRDYVRQSPLYKCLLHPGGGEDKDKDTDADAECAICFCKNDFQLNLSCGHSLCINCIQTMNNYSYERCPFCNTNINLNPIHVHAHSILDGKVNDS